MSDLRGEYQGAQVYTADRSLVIERTFLNSVYMWMTGGLLLSGSIALLTASSPGLVGPLMENSFLFWGLFLGQLGLVIFLTSRIAKMSLGVARLSFLLYSALTGFTLSIIFLIYTQESLFSTFIVAGGTFGLTSAYGYATGRDLSKLGGIMSMALIGLVLATVVNMFWANSTLYWITTYAGVLIFVGLTAYDTQKIKRLGETEAARGEGGQKLAILGALTLYLDFINLFLFMLRLMGNRR